MPYPWDNPFTVDPITGLPVGPQPAGFTGLDITPPSASSIYQHLAPYLRPAVTSPLSLANEAATGGPGYGTDAPLNRGAMGSPMAPPQAAPPPPAPAQAGQTAPAPTQSPAYNPVPWNSGPPPAAPPAPAAPPQAYPQPAPTAANAASMSSPAPAPAVQPDGSPPPDDVTAFKRDVQAGESGGNDNAKNPRSSASGRYQFTAGTFGDFLKNAGAALGFTAADINKPAAQEAAMDWYTKQNADTAAVLTGKAPSYDQLAFGHMFGTGALGAALKADPSAPLTSVVSPQAVSNNPSVVNPKMTVAAAMASTGNYYRTNGATAGGSAPAPGQPPQVDTAKIALNTAAAAPQGPEAKKDPDAQPSDYQPEGISGIDMKALMANLRPAPSPSEQLMAVGAGMLGAPTFGAGYGKGVENLLGLQQGYRKQSMDLAGLNQQIMSHQAQIHYQDAMLKLRDGQLGLNGKKVEQGDTRNAIGQQNADTKQAVAAGNLDGSAALARASAQANVKDQQAFDQQQEAARSNVRTIQADLLPVLQKEGPNGLVGPDVVSKVKRYLTTNLGLEDDQLGVSTSGIQLTEKGLAALRNGQLLTQTKGSIPRSNAELQALQAGFGQGKMSYPALMSVLSRDLAANQRVLAAGEAWHGMDPTQKSQALQSAGGLFANWRDGFSAQQQPDITSTGSAASRVQQTAGGWMPAGTTTSGKPVRFTVVQ